MQKATFDRTSGPRVLTLHDISPGWAKRLDQSPVPILSFKSLSWSLQALFLETCTVGEAYGYSDTYLKNSKACRLIGNDFQVSFITRSYADLETIKQKFVKHWNEKHAYITEELRIKRRARAARKTHKHIEFPVSV